MRDFSSEHFVLEDGSKIAVIGGGPAGISTAWQLIQRYPDKQIMVVEKESHFAGHQTGHNSGVIHAGVYYQPPFYRELKNIDGIINTNQKAQSSFQIVGASDSNSLEVATLFYKQTIDHVVPVSSAKAAGIASW